MEPLNEQEVVLESKPIAKVIISATALIASFTAGTQIDNEQIQVLKDDNQAKVERMTVLENEKAFISGEAEWALQQYIYSQASSNRIPTFDASIVSLNRIEEAYAKSFGTTTFSDTDLFIKGKEIAELKGDYICK